MRYPRLPNVLEYDRLIIGQEAYTTMLILMKYLRVIAWHWRCSETYKRSALRRNFTVISLQAEDGSCAKPLYEMGEELQVQLDG